MKDYKVVIFDLDGTLTDPQSGLVASFAYALDKMKIEYPSREYLLRFIGPPLYDEWRNCYGLSHEEVTRMLGFFHEYYSVYGWWDNTVYIGIPEMLSELKMGGKTLVVATSKPELFAKKVLDRFDMSKFFDFIGAAESEKIRDKKHEVIEYTLANIGNPERSECIMIGDRVFDAEGAKMCGIDSMGVLYGHGASDEIERAGFDFVAKSVEDITRLLL